MHKLTHTHTHTYTHTYTHIHTHIHTHTHTYTHIHTHTHTQTHTHTHIHTHAHSHAYIYEHRHTKIYKHMLILNESSIHCFEFTKACEISIDIDVSDDEDMSVSEVGEMANLQGPVKYPTCYICLFLFVIFLTLPLDRPSLPTHSTLILSLPFTFAFMCIHILAFSVARTIALNLTLSR
jgi:hypothetical protein